MTDEEMVELGLCDADKLDTTRPAFIRMLLDRGAAVEEIQAAAANGQHFLSALASEYAFFPPGDLDAEGVAEVTGVSVEEIVDIWRSLGLTDPRDAGKRLTDRDIDLVNFMVMARGLVGEDNVLDIARAFGMAIAQMAETSVTALRRGFERPQRGTRGEGSELAIQQAYGAFPDVVVPDLMRAIETVFLRGVVTSVYAEIAANDDAAIQSDRTIVFVDLVDFSGLARRTPTAELSQLLFAFESAVVDEAVRWRGRVVKMLGDGAMLVFAQRADGIEAARALVRHRDMPACRAGVASGRVFTRTADYFGPVVNLASRLSGAVAWGEVAIDDSAPVAGAQEMPDVVLKGMDLPIAYYRSR